MIYFNCSFVKAAEILECVQAHGWTVVDSRWSKALDSTHAR